MTYILMRSLIFTSLLNRRFTSYIILFTLSEIILTKNFFRYCDSDSTAMGSALALSYACLVRGLREEKFIHNPVQNTFLCWKLCCERLLNFLEYINSTKYYLSFHMEQHKSSLNFLDLTLYKGKSVLQPDCLG